MKFYFSAFIALSLINLCKAQVNSDLRQSKAYLKFEEAQDSTQKALAAGDSMQIAECYYVLGKRYVGLNNYIKGKQYFLRSLSIRESCGPSEEIARTYTRLIECEFSQRSDGNLDDAVRYAGQIMYNSIKAKTHLGLMNAYRAMGGLHWFAVKTGRRSLLFSSSPSLDSAIYYETKALKIATAMRKPIDIALSYDLLGNIWSDLGKVEKSIFFEMQAIKLYRKIGRVEAAIEPSSDIGQRCFKLGKYKLGKQWLDKSRNLADSCRWGTYDYLSSLSGAYADYYVATGDLAKALSYQKDEYQKKLKGEEAYRRMAIEGLALSLEDDRKELRLEMQRKERTIQEEKAKIQSWIVFLSILSFFFAGVAAILLYKLYKKYRTKSRKNEHLFLEQSHRIKNNLQTISDLLQLPLSTLIEPKAAQVLEESVLRVEAMSFIHRRLYGKHRSVEIEIGEYLEDLIGNILKSYNLADVILECDVERLSLHVDKAILLGLIVNELASNACKYALNKKSEARLYITCRKEGQNLFFVFRDNGPGFEIGRSQPSFGLDLIQIWVDNLEGESSFTFETGTCFTLSFEKQVKHDHRYESEINH
jgi:two-component sensor histidine kinase